MHNFIFTIITIAFSFCSGAQDELNSVVVIFRHGDRTPVRPYATDPYKNASYWPVDFGQLTNLGKRQEYELGKWLRARYDSFLPLTYSEKDIYVRSTDVDRTLMSAEANLAGLYPPQNNQIWDNDIKWQPIPIHTIPEDIDNVLAAKKPCAKYDLLFNQLMKTAYFQNISHRNHDLYSYLTRYSGDTISTLEKLEYLYNTLLIETLNNFTLPVWAEKVFPKKLEPWAFLSFAVPTFTRDLARLKMGPLFNEIGEYFENRSKNVDVPKFRMYSAHDITIGSVLNTMGAFEYHSPPYASTVLFELRRRPNGRFYVRMFYKNTTEARGITLRNCNSDCDLVDFMTVLRPIMLTVQQWEKECRSNIYAWPLIVIGSVMSIVLAIAFVMLGVCIGEKVARPKDNKRYMKLLNDEVF